MIATKERSVSGESPFIVCAFYTDGYASEAKALKASLDRHMLPYDLRRFENRGVWEANTRIKPEFLRDCLAKYQDRDIVYIDADAVVRAPLTLFESFENDIGVFVAPNDGNFSHRYLTGTLYLRNNPKSRIFVESWINAQVGMMLGVDQDSFGIAMAQHPELTVYPLPAAYVKIYDRGDEVPVIEHFQASRTRVKLARTLKKTRNIAIGLAFAGFIIWMLLRWL